MAVHHTKDKGDLGTAKAHADLVGLGFMVLFPATEHGEFDLVAYRERTFYRVQVKYRSARAGTVSVSFRSVWADRNGTHTKPSDKAEVDVVCIYCPDTDRCYYLRPQDFGRSVTLRLVPSSNRQSRGVHLAADFVAFPHVREPSGQTRRATRPAASPDPRRDEVRMSSGPATYEVAGPHPFPDQPP